MEEDLIEADGRIISHEYPKLEILSFSQAAELIFAAAERFLIGASDSRVYIGLVFSGFFDPKPKSRVLGWVLGLKF